MANLNMQSWMRLRLAVVYLVFASFIGFVIFRLVQLQVIEDGQLSQLAKKQFHRTQRRTLHRLTVYDRNGEELAVNTLARSVFARPNQIKHKRSTARKLSRLLGKGRAYWYKRLNSERSFVWIRRQVDPKTAASIQKLRLPGIKVVPEKKRLYPNGKVASNTLGFTDIDGRGLAGVELMLNKELFLEHDKFRFSRDGKGNASYIEKKHAQRSSLFDKRGVYLTLDRRLQFAVEEEIARSLKETEAKTVMAVVMEPLSGEVLAIAQAPTFDPNEVRQFPSNLYANRLISYLYEPGSTLKVLFAAHAIEKGLLNSDSPIDCGEGKIEVKNTVIRESSSKHKFAQLPLKDVIRLSSNVGAVRIAQQLGKKGIEATFQQFRLDKKTKMGLPGEAIAKKRGWNPLRIATAGFGQGVAFTPLQLVAAFSPFANGGYWIRPKILLRETLAIEDPPRVLSKRTAILMREMLASVTAEGGTGTAAAIEGFRVAGKTGTAQKYEKGKGYQSGKYYSSFVGFLPAEKPKLLIGVMVDEPKTEYYASKVAAPLFKRIAERSLQVLDLIPKRAIAISPKKPRSPIVARPAVQLKKKGKRWLMPDLHGLSAREVLRTIGPQFPKLKLKGEGYVHSQSPAPGTTVTSRTPLKLTLRPG